MRFEADVYEHKWPPDGWLTVRPNCEGCGIDHFHIRRDLYNKLRAIWDAPPLAGFDFDIPDCRFGDFGNPKE